MMDGIEDASARRAETDKNKTITPADEIPQRMDVQELLRGEREIILVLQQAEYRLRLTSRGKLVLNN